MFNKQTLAQRGEVKYDPFCSINTIQDRKSTRLLEILYLHTYV